MFVVTFMPIEPLIETHSVTKQLNNKPSLPISISTEYK
jgi:hypothetical protein